MLLAQSAPAVATAIGRIEAFSEDAHSSQQQLSVLIRPISNLFKATTLITIARRELATEEQRQNYQPDLDSSLDQIQAVVQRYGASNVDNLLECKVYIDYVLATAQSLRQGCGHIQQECDDLTSFLIACESH